MAGKQLKDFPAASALADADVLFASQAGAEKALTAAQVAAYINANRFNQTLLGWAAVQAFIGFTRLTVDANGYLATASIVWPDGKAGTFTIDSRDSGGAVLAWHATWVDGATTKTVTQATITRDPSDGSATVQPTMTIS